MPRNGCSALHGVNHNKKKDIAHFKVILWKKQFVKNGSWSHKFLICGIKKLIPDSQITKPLILTPHFRFRTFILFVQTKKWLPWAATQAAKNTGDSEA